MKEERKTGLYTLFDEKAEAHGPIFEAVNHAVAARSVRAMKIEWPEDYTLWYIGEREGRNIKPMNDEIPWQNKLKEVSNGE
jgi:hypothetical protein